MAQGSSKGVPIDTDATLSADSDALVASQKATKTYIDTEILAVSPPSLTGNALKYLRVNAGETATEWATVSGGVSDGDTLSTGLTFPNTGLHLLDTDASHDLIIKPGSNLSADRTLTITTGDSDRTLTLSGNADITGTNTGDQTSVSGNAGTATTLQTARKVNSVSFDGSEDIAANNQVLIYQALGSAIKAVPFWCSDASPQSIGGTNQSNQLMRVVAIFLNKGDTISGVKWIQNQQGVYTANNYNGWGLYSYSGGTLTLVASSTDDGNIWKGTSGSLQTKAFSSTYSASAGLYFLASLYCQSAQTTAPSLASANYAPIGAFNTLDFTNSAKLMSTISGQTALPATQAMSGLTSSTQYIHAMLY